MQGWHFTKLTWISHGCTWVPKLALMSNWRRKWQLALVFLPGGFHGQRSLVSYGPWGQKEPDTAEWMSNNEHTLSTTLDARNVMSSGNGSMISNSSVFWMFSLSRYSLTGAHSFVHATCFSSFILPKVLALAVLLSSQFSRWGNWDIEHLENLSKGRQLSVCCSGSGTHICYVLRSFKKIFLIDVQFTYNIVLLSGL